MTTPLAFSQTAFDGQNAELSAIKNEHYIYLDSIYRLENPKINANIFLGNSLTEQGNWQSYFKDKNILNRGIGGDVTFGVLHRLYEIIRHQPENIFIEIGVNDIGTDTPTEVILDNYEKIIKTLQNNCPQSKIYIQSILPINNKINRLGLPNDFNSKVMLCNYKLKKLASDNNITFINLYPLFTNRKGFLKSNYTTDGLHLNKNGYQTWVSFIKRQKNL